MARSGPPPPLRIRLIGRTLNGIVARAPFLWPMVRAPMRHFFERAAPGWDERTGAGSPDHLAALAAATAQLSEAPERALDIGCGTGEGTLFLAREFPTARVRGVDLSEEMIRLARGQGRARSRGPGRLQGRRRRRPSLARRLLRPRRAGQHAAILRRDRPGAAPRGQRHIAVEPRDRNPLLHPAPRPRARISRQGIEQAGDGGAARAPTSSPGFRFSPDGDVGSALRPAGEPVRRRRARQGPAADGRGRADKRRVPSGSSRPAASSTAIAEALRAAEAGEMPVVMSGDGLIGAVGGALAGTEGRLGVIPGGAATTSRACTRHPHGHRRGGGGRSPPGIHVEIDVGEVNGGSFLCIASFGFDSDANRIANEARLVRGNLVYVYAALRALACLEAGALHLELDGRALSVQRLLGGGREQPGLRRWHVRGPRRRARRRPAGRGYGGEVGKLRFLANLPKVFKGTHVDKPEVAVSARPDGPSSAPTGRSRYMPTATRSPTFRQRVRVLPRALRVIVAAPATLTLRRRLRAKGRARARDRGAQPAQRTGRRDDTARAPAAADRARRDRQARRRAAGRLHDRQRHQRQDDHGRR